MQKLLDFFIELFSKLLPKKYREKYFSLVKSEGFMYLVFGFLTTVVSYLSYALATRIFHLDVILSDVISWICSVTFAFVTNKLYVFKSMKRDKKSVLKEGISFYTARLLSLGIEVVMIYILIRPPFSVNDLIAKLLGNIVVLIVNYFLSKLIIFKK